MIIVPACEDFLNRVANAVVDIITKLEDPLTAAHVRVFLPNNRSCRTLRDILVKRNIISILPKFVVPIDAKSVNDNISGIYDVFRNLDLNCKPIAKFELASSLFNETQNIVYEKMSLNEAVKNISNQNMVELFATSFEAAIPYIKTIEIEACTNYVKNTSIPFVCAGFSFSHTYLLDFLKAAHQNKYGTLVFQQQIDHHGLFAKLISYIEEDGDFRNNAVECNPSNVSVIHANTLLDEAKTVATIIRANIGKSIAIVYTDKQLMHSIKAYAKKWNIFIDDAVGTSFTETKEGVLLLLILQAIRSGFKTDETLEIIRYIDIFDCDKILKTALLNWKIRFVDVEEFYEYTQHPAIVYLRSIAQKFSGGEVSLDEQLIFFEECFYFFAEYLSNEKSESMCTIFEHLHRFSKHVESIDDYYYIAVKIMDMFSTQEPTGYTPNVISIGPLEAQLITSDIVIVCGFSDQNWIVNSNSYLFDNTNDPRLNIDVRRNHDITNTLNHIIQSSEHVFITNSSAGNSGICRLIDEFFNEQQINVLKQNGMSWTFTDVIEKLPQVSPPSPSPDLKYRPLRYSASDIELLITNPYALYTKKILKLVDINDVTSESYKGRLKGTIFHEAISITKTQRVLNIQQSLTNNVKNILKNLRLDQHHFIDWLIKLELISEFVAKNIADDLSEVAGSITIAISDLNVTLKCIADSIVISDSGIVIVDYKTGALPSYKDILTLRKPQILIEGIIALRNGFFGLHNKEIRDLILMQLGSSHKSQKLLKLSEIKDVKSIKNTIEKAERDLIELLDKFLVRLSPYTAISGGYYDKHDHLARGAEWGTYM